MSDICYYIRSRQIHEFVILIAYAETKEFKVSVLREIGTSLQNEPAFIVRGYFLVIAAFGLSGFNEM
jgi:hypothetical protein